MAAEASAASSSGASTAPLAPVIKRRLEPGSVTKVIKIGVMGDGTVGKTTFLLSYITQGFITEYTPTVFDNFSAIEEIDNEVINVILWDLAGQDEYSNIRSACYSNVVYDVILLCYSAVHRDSFDNIKFKWLPELKKILLNTPFMLVATKTDLRSPSDSNHVSTKEGDRRAKEIKARKFVECTAKEPPSISRLIREAIGIILERDYLRKEKIAKQYKKDKAMEDKLMAQEAKRLAKEEKLHPKESEGDDDTDVAPAPAAVAPSAVSASSAGREHSSSSPAPAPAAAAAVSSPAAAAVSSPAAAAAAVSSPAAAGPASAVVPPAAIATGPAQDHTAL